MFLEGTSGKKALGRVKEPYSTNVRTLSLGSANGSIRNLFAKIKTIDDKHGKFDFALCVGDFFGKLKEKEDTEDAGDDEISLLLEGKLPAPIECYIMQGENPLPDAVIQKFAKTGGELCKDVFLMSKSGLVTTASGLRVACLGGTFEASIFSSAESAPGFASPFFSEQTVEKLLSNSLTTSSAKQKQNYKSLASIQSSSSSSQLVDVLVTNVWPACVTEFSSVPLPSSFAPSSKIGAAPLDDVCRHLRPRYHFAAGAPDGNKETQPVFWEREPFVWDDDNGNGNGRTSRFISLGSFNGTTPVNGKKQRWFYAFSIEPESASSTAQKPKNASKNPFTENVPRKRPFQEVQSSQGENYIFGNVRQPVKRTRIENTDGKPPPGYKCRRCDSTEHFIHNCPERQKPPEGYVCRICNTAGHLVRDCPSSSQNAVGDTGGRKPKEGYVCRACGNEGGHYLDDCPVVTQRGGGGGGKRGPPREIGPEECWFCLSNPNLAKHLITSIGEECYVTLPKGQIIPTQSAASENRASSRTSVPGGGHVLIVPITHYPTFNTIPSDLAPPIIEETEKYKHFLRNFYAKHACHPVFLEISRLGARGAKGVHAHIQCVPLPQSIKTEEVEEAFVSQARSQGIVFEQDAEDALRLGAGGAGYFKVELPDGKKMVHLINPGVPFGIQFGRQVLTNLLGFSSRVDWKTCTLDEEEDRADAEAFKAGFGPFVTWT
ncbi:CwfJ C-terminus 1-domain-containing protein-like protein [Lentinula aff. lateritia]|uniref:CwfJ C-terminus 1-domain-containing protein-like protein n=1 Tax=Lentinula aff. lateritia TaxID=2804960 RepID=A0ACC1TVU6_9AGAR|nr:CwfJ C-terminus 1-domain-containing protein-like protein [Lentinula aff. lateritia]